MHFTDPHVADGRMHRLDVLRFIAAVGVMGSHYTFSSTHD
jgi:peptidoglycan/LPS O-acetylase OafA/YrhL